MSGDALFSWYEAVNNPSAAYHNWHPPLVAYTWRLLNKLPVGMVPPYANLFLFMTVLFWIGISLAAHPWIDKGKDLHTVIFCLCAGFFPPVFAILSQPVKDGLMCAALIAAYGGLILAESKSSWLAFAFALFCLFLALGYRHNAVFAVVPLALWAGHILSERLVPGFRGYLDTRFKQSAVGISIAGGLILLAFTTSNALTKAPSFPIQSIYTFDLVGMSVKANNILLPVLFDDYDKPPVLHDFFVAKGDDIPSSPLTLGNLRQLYNPATNLDVYFYGSGKGLRFIDTEEELLALRQAWLRAIVANPTAYLSVRWDIYGRLMGFMPNPLWPYYCMAPSEPTPAGIFYRALPEHYLQNRDSILYKGYFYFIGIIFILAAISWKKNIFARHMHYLVWSGLIYGASYFVIAPSADFRYLYWIVIVFILLTLNFTLTIVSMGFREGATKPG